jgi:hypothetical protein
VEQKVHYLVGDSVLGGPRWVNVDYLIAQAVSDHRSPAGRLKQLFVTHYVKNDWRIRLQLFCFIDEP